MTNFFVVAKFAFVLAVAMTGITLLVWYLGVESLNAPKCFGRDLTLANLKRDMPIFVLWGLVISAMLGVMAFGKREWLTRHTGPFNVGLRFQRHKSPSI